MTRKITKTVKRTGGGRASSLDKSKLKREMDRVLGRAQYMSNINDAEEFCHTPEQVLRGIQEGQFQKFKAISALADFDIISVTEIDEITPSRAYTILEQYCFDPFNTEEEIQTEEKVKETRPIVTKTKKCIILEKQKKALEHKLEQGEENEQISTALTEVNDKLKKELIICSQQKRIIHKKSNNTVKVQPEPEPNLLIRKFKKKILKKWKQ